VNGRAVFAIPTYDGQIAVLNTSRLAIRIAKLPKAPSASSIWTFCVTEWSGDDPHLRLVEANTGKRNDDQVDAWEFVAALDNHWLRIKTLDDLLADGALTYQGDAQNDVLPASADCEQNRR
jgi:hypothetical protein